MLSLHLPSRAVLMHVFIRTFKLKIYFFRIFRVVLLFSYQSSKSFPERLCCCCFSATCYILSHLTELVNNFFHFSFFVRCFSANKKHSKLHCVSGEGGIRTHAPLRTNGFQDRLVMTTSIPLQTCLVCCSLEQCLTSISLCLRPVNNFFNFLLCY